MIDLIFACGLRPFARSIKPRSAKLSVRPPATKLSTRPACTHNDNPWGRTVSIGSRESWAAGGSAGRHLLARIGARRRFLDCPTSIGLGRQRQDVNGNTGILLPTR
jgi:hypothetical protein